MTDTDIDFFELDSGDLVKLSKIDCINSIKGELSLDNGKKFAITLNDYEHLRRLINVVNSSDGIVNKAESNAKKIRDSFYQGYLDRKKK